MKHIPLSGIPKDRIVWMDTHRCTTHRHTYLEHRRCYIREQLGIKEERIGFLDIETSALDATWGCVLCWCILDEDGKIYKDYVTKDDIDRYGRTGKIDKRILRTFVETSARFDRFVTHNGARFDVPFLRTRAVICGERFPTYGAVYHIDTLVALWKKFRLSANGLGAATQMLRGKTEKNHLSQALLHEFLRGKDWARKFVVNHCERDVRDTKELFKIVSPYIRITKTSI